MGGLVGGVASALGGVMERLGDHGTSTQIASLGIGD